MQAATASSNPASSAGNAGRRVVVRLLLAFSIAFLSAIQSVHAATVTVITHGFQSPAASGAIWPLPWVDSMANQIVAQAVAKGGYGSVWAYDPGTQKFVLQSQTAPVNDPRAGLENIVLKFNWAQESDDAGGGFAEAAGEALFAALMRGGEYADGTTVSFTEVPFHFIGHSRGAVVNSEAVERLGAIGINVDHVTTLDPRPAPSPYQDSIAGVNVWSNILFADNYWRTDGIGPFVGMSMPNTFERQLDETILSAAGYSSEHSDVHLWYFGTINQLANANDGEQTVPANWFNGTMGPRNIIGWNFSRLGGGSRSANGSAGLKGANNRTPIPSQSWVVNGDFAYTVNIAELFDVAGYSFHGGTRSGIQLPSSYWVLSLTAQTLRHNRIYIPQMQGAAALRFRVSCNTLLDHVSLEVTGFGRQLTNIPFTSSSDWTYVDLDLSAYQGQTSTLEFTIKDADFPGVSILIDDIQM